AVSRANPMNDLILAALAVAGWTPYLATRLTRDLHILQLEEYDSARYLQWWRARWRRTTDWRFVGFNLLVVVATLLGAVLGPETQLVSVLAFATMHLVQWRRQPKTDAKKPLVWTARARRLFFITLAVTAAIVALIAVTAGVIWLTLIGLTAMAQFTPALLALGNAVAQPVEAAYRRYYREDAKRLLRRVNPVVIGVAGSYGKTTTKEIVAALVAAHGPTLKPPGSYNTLMGVTRVIREQLSPEHRYFVVEMGDYQRGDIAELCDLVQPTLGAITAVGPEHLERFGSMDNVQRAKEELVAALPSTGVIVINTDTERARSIADATTRVRVVRVGLDPAGRPDVTATNIQTDAHGVSFEVVQAGRPPLRLRSMLLGRHNVGNLLVGVALAREVGVPDETIAATTPTIKPPDHRLQLIRTPGGPTVIDDAYNANPAGVKAALDVLAEFPAKVKVLVTPGMVELGDFEREANVEFGRQAAAVCDAVILVGPNRAIPIAEGLRSGGMSDDRIIVVRTLKEATDHLGRLVGAGDVVLFCNDLPDHYDE
ncbi:MAG: UDP-N-acetylmuramoyl-tripeptide--D-alanyl-D-alanine ligase, partial [Dehalococcoidia bacterium]|nr:UDP-N-acetylmuramoyl-tripeptide--D-alanyl-D-alanine ligase [Dehalococcoidia bacterium]